MTMITEPTWIYMTMFMTFNVLLTTKFKDPRTRFKYVVRSQYQPDNCRWLHIIDGLGHLSTHLPSDWPTAYGLSIYFVPHIASTASQ